MSEEEILQEVLKRLPEKRLPFLVARISQLEAEVAALREALSEVIAALRVHAPGTPLNHHSFDALGIKANAALSSTAASDFEARVRAEEREACARVADDCDLMKAYATPGALAESVRNRISDAIRARGNPEGDK